MAALFGVACAIGAQWFIATDGLAGEPVPRQLWVWVALTGLATGVMGLGWRGVHWRRRGASMLAVPLCLLSTALAVNGWVGYFPSVQDAWSQLTGGPLPDQVSGASVNAVAEQTRDHHVLPATGSVVPVDIPSTASKFRHRGELVYLPPAWFTSSPPPKLPTVMMIGGEFNTPADWLRAGNAIATTDNFAATHGGNAPVLVFVDAGGAFNNDTECVNGPRGNAADHLTKDVVPFMTANFGVRPGRSNWGIVGYSMGGTCAVDLATMHPDMFGAIVDIAGDQSPNSGNKAQTVDRLFGGDTEAWSAFDPATVITRHGPYDGLSIWFAVNGAPASAASQRREVAVGDHRTGGTAGNGSPDAQTTAANSLCGLGAANGIDCVVIAQPGKHDWPFAARVFTAALPWLAGAIHTPGDPVVPLAPPAGGTGQRSRTEAARR